MSVFTCYDNEEEHLIFETRLHIKDIWIPREKVWIGKKWMKRLSLFDLIIHGTSVHNEYLLTKKNQQKLCNTLNRIMSGDVSTISSSSYLNLLIRKMTIEKKKIWLDVFQIKQLQSNLQELFLNENQTFGNFVKKLKDDFSVKVCPVFKAKWTMSDDTFDLIERVAKKYDDIRMYGVPITFIAPNEKQISFRPQLTMVDNLFDIQMQLVDTSDVEQIKIHIDLYCKELGGFYTSLHPRFMNVKHYNSWDIALPSRDTKSSDSNSIDLEMSICLHNFEDFGIDYQDLSANLEPITQEIIHTNQSYKWVDMLSITYGITNFLMSIFDSVSDVTFLIFLSLISSTVTTTIILSLTIGNLVSVAIFIALYMTYQIKSNNVLLKIGFFILFVMCSPFLGSVDWIFKRFQRDERNQIVMDCYCGFSKSF